MIAYFSLYVLRYKTERCEITGQNGGKFVNLCVIQSIIPSAQCALPVQYSNIHVKKKDYSNTNITERFFKKFLFSLE